MTYSPFSMTAARGALETSPSAFHVMALPVRPSTLRVGMTWNEQGQVTKSPKGMVIQDGAYVGLD